MRLAPRNEYERSSMPSGLRSLKMQENTSLSSSLTDMTDVKKKKRPFSLSVEQHLPIPRIQLSPLGGAKNKVPLKKVSSAPGSASRNRKSTKARLNTVEMDTFKLTLGDGDIGSSTTDDLSPLWQPDASPRLPSKLQSRGYNRMEEHEEECGSMQSLNSSGSSAVFSLGSPDPGGATDHEISPLSHSTPKVMPTGTEAQRESKNGSETFYETFVEADFDSNPPLRSSASSILRPKLNGPFSRSVFSQAGGSKGHNKNLTNRDSGLSEVSSTVSVDSGASRFSYSDLPAITTNLVNEADEITEL